MAEGRRRDCKRATAYLKHSDYEHAKDANLGHARTAIDEIGMHFGSFAADQEKQWRKPTSGLFLIREVCNGLPVDAAVKKIESGKIDPEIEAFAKKHFASLFPKK